MDSEIIVCDNNSSDDTAAIASAAGARVIFEPLNQISRARNTGATAAKGEWLLFLDADSHPSPALFEDLAKILTDSTIIGGGATLTHDSKYVLYGIALAFWNQWSKIAKEAAGSFLFCRRDGFDAIGGFSAVFYAAEEIDFCRRLKKFGKTRGQKLCILSKHPMVTSARKAALYTPGETLRFMLKTAFMRGRNLTKKEECPIWYDGRR